MRIPFLHKKQSALPASAPELSTLAVARLGVIAAIGAIVAAMLVFLYRDFYQTIVQARVVIVLKQEVALENIDLKLFDRVQQVHEYKITPLITEPIADPFKTAPLFAEAPQPEDESGQPSKEP